MSESQYDFLLQLAGRDGTLLWLARETNVGVSRLVTVKQIDLGMLDRVSLEAHLNAAVLLSHPAVNVITDVGQEGDSKFVVTGLLRGETLAMVLNRLRQSDTPIAPAVAIHIVSEVAGALHAAHRLVDATGRQVGFYHAELTPASIVLTYDGAVKVVDFEGSPVHLDPSVGGLAFHKAAYMSPEQCLAGTVDSRSDIYRLGVILWELLTGQPRFTGDDEFEIMEAISEEASRRRSAVLPAPSKFNRDIPPFLDAIVRKAGARTPKKRFTSCEHIRQSMLKVGRRLGGDVGPADVAALLSTTFPRRAHHWTAVSQSERSGDDQTASYHMGVLFGLQEDVEEPPTVEGALFEPHAAPQDEVWEPVTQQAAWDPSELDDHLKAAWDNQDQGWDPHNETTADNPDATLMDAGPPGADWEAASASEVFDQLDNLFSSGKTLGEGVSAPESGPRSDTFVDKADAVSSKPASARRKPQTFAPATTEGAVPSVLHKSGTTPSGEAVRRERPDGLPSDHERTKPFTDINQLAAQLQAHNKKEKPATPAPAASAPQDEAIPVFSDAPEPVAPASPSDSAEIFAPVDVEPDAGVLDSPPTQELDQDLAAVKPRGGSADAVKDAPATTTIAQEGPPRDPSADLGPILPPVDYDEDEEEDEAFVEPFSLDELIEARNTIPPGTSNTSKPVVDVLRIRDGIIMGQQTLRRSGKSYKPSASGLSVTFHGDSASITTEAGVTGWVQRGTLDTRDPIPAGATIKLNVGDNAEVESPDLTYRLRVYRPPSMPKGSFSSKAVRAAIVTGVIVYGVALIGSILLHASALMAFEYVGQLGVQLTVPESKEQAEKFAEGKLKKVDKKKASKPKPVAKKDKPKNRPKPKPKPPADPTEQKVTVPKSVRKLLKNRMNKRGKTGKASAKGIVKSLASPHKGEGKSIKDVVSNIDAANKNSENSAFDIGGTLSAKGIPGGEVNIGKGGGGDIGKLQKGVAGGSKAGKLEERAGKGKGKVRGQVRSVAAMARVQGSLSRGDVLKTINRYMGRIQGCYERALLQNPNLGGKITFQWTVAANGRVNGARQASSSMGNAQVSNCIGVIRRMKFPKPKGGAVTIRYPFIFRAQQ